MGAKRGSSRERWVLKGAALLGEVIAKRGSSRKRWVLKGAALGRTGCPKGAALGRGEC